MWILPKDVYFAVRQLRRHKVYAATAIISMALGIGATTAVYSVLYGVLIDPYPYGDAAHIATMSIVDKNGVQNDAPFTLSQIDLLRQTHALTSVIGERQESMILTGGLPQTIHAVEATGNLFQFLDVRPLKGRVFTPADAPQGSAPEPVAVISYLFWKSHFNADPGVLGKPLQLNHQTYGVIGVMGPRVTWNDAEVYLPMPAGLAPDTPFETLFRVREGTSMASAASELESIVRTIAHDHPQFFPSDGFRITVQSLNDWLLGQFKGTLLTLFMAVALLLLIACGNVSILMLARGAAREYELALRSALGAARARIVRQLLTEAVLLSVSGGAAGIAIAYGAIRLIVALIPEFSIPHEVVIGLNVPVLIFSTAVSVGTGILAGLWPALQLSRPQVSQTIQAGGTKGATSSSGQRLRSALIIGQIAVTVLLLAASGAAMRNFLEAYGANLGFDPANVLTLSLTMPEHSNQTWQERVNYEDAMIEKLGHLSGAVSAALASDMPPDGNLNQAVEVIGKPVPTGSKTLVTLISSDYFSTMKVPLLEGRALTRSEVLRGAHVAVVSVSFARKYLQGGQTLGQQVRLKELEQEFPGVIPGPAPKEPYQVVGISVDIRNDGLHRPVQPQIYVPSSVLTFIHNLIVVRTRQDAAQLMQPAAAALRDLNREQAVDRSFVYEEYLGEFVWARERFISTLFGFFSSLALGLAAIGLISVVAFTVEQRTREIGIRSALGASRGNILRLVSRPTVLNACVGLAIGIGLSIGLSNVAYRWTQSSMRDSTVLLGTSAVLLVLTTVSSILTARRASSIEPVEALRAQ